MLAAAVAGLAVGLSGRGSGGTGVEPVIERSVGAAARPGVAPAVLPSTPSRLQDYRAEPAAPGAECGRAVRPDEAGDEDRPPARGRRGEGRFQLAGP